MALTDRHETPGAGLLAAPNARLGDLKARMGHDSAHAAMIYQHATADADRMIADALDRRITDAGKLSIPVRTMTTGRRRR